MLELTKESFEDEVLRAEGRVLVDFYGDGCAPCQALRPHIERLEEACGARMKFAALNTTKARRLAISQRVLGLPAVAVYGGGEKLAELVKDDATPESVEALVKKYL